MLRIACLTSILFGRIVEGTTLAIMYILSYLVDRQVRKRTGVVPKTDDQELPAAGSVQEEEKESKGESEQSKGADAGASRSSQGR